MKSLLGKFVPNRRRTYELAVSPTKRLCRSIDSVLNEFGRRNDEAAVVHERNSTDCVEVRRMSDNGDVSVISSTRRELEMVQDIIDISASKLNSLRTQCATNSELTKQEIRTLEGKLVKLFSKQLVVKHKCGGKVEEFKNYPNLARWLQVVGINEDAIKELGAKSYTVEGLLSLSDDRLKALVARHADKEEASRRLVKALRHLHAYTERQKQGHKDSTSKIYWDSWDANNQTTRLSKSSEHNDSDPGMPLPSPDPDTDASRLSAFSNSDMSDSAPSPKHSPRPPFLFHSKQPPPLKRSASDEASLGNRINIPVDSGSSTVGKKRGKKLSPIVPLTVSIPKSSSGADLSMASQSDSESEHNRSSYCSNSPRTPTRLAHYGMGHAIKHRFSHKTFVVSLSCDFCNKLLLVGVKCKKCKTKFHKKCSLQAPPSCGLPKGYEDYCKQQFRRGIEYRSLPMMRYPVKRTHSEPSNIAHQIGEAVRAKTMQNRSHNDLYSVDRPPVNNNEPHLAYREFPPSGDSCSTSSAASAASSTPPPSPSHARERNDSGLVSQEELDQFDEGSALPHFSFPDVTGTSISRAEYDTLLAKTESSKSFQSSNTTISNDSTLSGGDVPGVESIDAQISDFDPESRTWQRRKGQKAFGKAYMLLDLHQRGSLMSEWIIPFEELQMFEVLGTGRFGKVHRGRWHGEVAIKTIEIENPTEEQLNAFRSQVTTFRKTRHENVVLFMGACMNPPKLAIITSLCRGLSLYQHVHVRKDNFPLLKIGQICTQIAQGMGYLHARGVVHTDLRSKNVFLELNGRVVITDFGLYSVAGLTSSLTVRSARPGYLMIPRGWLYYLAPEIMCSLTTTNDLPDPKLFTKQTDIYAFGTVWYEMCAGSWPFKKQAPEAVIWQIGKGMKQSLNRIPDLPQEARDCLKMCWAYNPDARCSFSTLLKAFDRFPKKHRLTRSPSQPCTVGRVAETM